MSSFGTDDSLREWDESPSGWMNPLAGMDETLAGWMVRFANWMDPLAGMDETLAGWMVPLMRDWMIAFGRDEIPAEFGMVPLGRGFWIKNYG